MPVADNLPMPDTLPTLRIVSTSKLKGWAAAAQHIGTTSGKLRRLAKAGKLTSSVENNAHVFDVAELDRVREELDVMGSVSADSGRHVAADDVAEPAPPTINESVDTPPGATKQDAPVDDEIAEIRRAAIREQAEAERIRAATIRVAAEVEHARAVHERDEWFRATLERKRNQRIDEIVEAATATVFSFEEQRVDQLLRERLQGVQDFDDRLTVAALVARAVSDARAQLASEKRIAEERAAAVRGASAESARIRAQSAQAQSIAQRQHERTRRIQTIVTDVAREFQSVNADPRAIAYAQASAQQHLETLDEQTLNGAAWPVYAARLYASAALGLQPPEPPVVWDVRYGWRWLQPGE